MNIPKTSRAPLQPVRRSLGEGGCLLIVALVLLVALLGQFARAADANPPGKMTFQGFLTDASNPPVPLGNASPENKSVIFKIYKSATGTASSDVLWAESQVVTVDKGHFSALLGEGSSVSGLPHNADLSGVFIGADASDRWIGITVDGSEITPRIQFFAAPYAQLARTANTLVGGAQVGSFGATGNVTVDGLLTANGSNSGLAFQDRTGGGTPWQWYSEGGIARLWRLGDKITVSDSGRIGAAGLDISGTSTLTGNVGIGTSSPSAKLDVNGNVTVTGSVTTSGSVAGLIFNNRQGGSSWQWYGDSGTARLWNGSDRLAVTSGGNVGIGTANPVAMLDVVGSARAISYVSTANVAAHEQGAWLEWNKNGEGTTYLLNHKGLGIGGIVFGEVSTDNTITERMRISSSGSVGIGTAAPAATLHVNGGMRVEGGNTIEFGGGVAGKEGNAGKIGYQTFTTGSLEIIGAGSGSGATRNVRVWDRLGIGTSTPGFPLHVLGGVAQQFQLEAVLGSQGAGDIANQTRSDLSHSIVASQRIRAASFDVESDARIKYVLGRTSGQDSLQTIRQLKVTDYAYIDKITHGGRPQRGLVAQEVSEVLPEAVGQSVGVIPNIYALAISWEFDAAKKQLSVELKNAHPLKIDDVVSLILGDAPIETKVLDVPSSNSFVVAAKERPHRLFVIGQQVKDFRTVDYDLVFTTGLNALQELDRQVQALKKSEARIADLEQKTARIAELEEKAARVDALEREIAELKRLVASLAQGQSEQRSVAGTLAAARQ